MDVREDEECSNTPLGRRKRGNIAMENYEQRKDEVEVLAGVTYLNPPWARFDHVISTRAEY
jgi:chorismate synthase